MSTNELLSPIACELCRRRKCKCDRNLPFCKQCVGEPSKCTYPESGKRGLPQGYLNQLELRLADTELALFEALSTLRSINTTTTLVKVSRKCGAGSTEQKSTRTREWSRLPLDGWPNLERWWEAKRDHFIAVSVQDELAAQSPGSRSSVCQLAESSRSRHSTAIDLTDSSPPFRHLQSENTRGLQQTIQTARNPDASPEQVQQSLENLGHALAPAENMREEYHGQAEWTQAPLRTATNIDDHHSGKARRLADLNPTMYF
ncbi:hypothetical protein ASPZODRAFT_129955 [Penicilliopsis zonata CBS 506.65]|uniref:Zn(2)-C6 fungal-type domain-containing protein n=1 Tax=Penicilliopsis zonata CBS 506.65 TaxID=1073090 RepID=A0A1L9SQG8_9EURO|nr:hypothetical protein ASPZODRAFT_129955 [Penicilliopsis zonata CBS 506.65]OJJ49475.1 hypothetical protein ASPZODRAFT_129955 [Penicilliopsis zonata CBS 506.65]